MGALSTTWDEHYRTPFAPLLDGVTFVSNSDPSGLEAAVSDKTAAIIVEPLQGEGGVRPLRPEMAAAIRSAREKSGALLIADEVQCGLGRTGVPFYSATLGLQPDLISVGKALGGGVPVGAALISERIATTIAFGDHGTTYGGNLLSTRAALYVLEQLDALAPHIRQTGALFEQKLLALQEQHPVITAVRGAGLMRGLELAVDAAPVVEAALKAGLLVNRTAERVVRMLPPLTVTAAEIEEATGILDGALRSVSVEEVKA
jgi:acetylornithine/succinyldiaminopimelate/putrescine aminotransferase